jgi:peptide-methionine (S)-S-oxide reductase
MTSLLAQTQLYRTIIVCCSLLFTHSLYADKAIFSGGCFWCVEAAFQDLPGVSSAVSGFTGGTLQNPTYQGNHKGHYEAVEVSYDPNKISYQELLNVYWVNVDPFDKRGQFCDKGSSYLSAIFVANDEQRSLAEQSHAKVVDEFRPNAVVTPILTANKFWPVETYHQDYYQRNPIRYHLYRRGCGRDQRLEQIWGDRAKH